MLLTRYKGLRPVARDTTGFGHRARRNQSKTDQEDSSFLAFIVLEGVCRFQGKDPVCHTMNQPGKIHPLV